MSDVQAIFKKPVISDKNTKLGKGFSAELILFIYYIYIYIYKKCKIEAF